MIKLVDPRIEELAQIEIAKEKRKSLVEIPHRVDSQTFILVRKGKEGSQAVEEFKRRWKEFQDYDAQHAEPFLSK